MEVLINSIASLSLSLIGLSIPFKVYKEFDKIFDTKDNKKLKDRKIVNFFLGAIRDSSISRGYIDYFYKIYFVQSAILISEFILHFDQWIIDGLINKIGASNVFGGESIGHAKSERISLYLFGLFTGTIPLLQLFADF